jgi:hypothetical protein
MIVQDYIHKFTKMRGKSMRIVLIIIGLIVLSPFLMLGVYSLDFIYYGANDHKAEKAALEYLEDKYAEDFEVDDVEYNKVLGDDEGGYTLQLHPLNEPEITISVHVTEKYQVTRDNYKESKWGYEFRKEMVPIIEPIFQDTGKIYVYGSFPEELEKQYQFEDSYQTIYNENPLQSYERIHIVNFVEPFEKEKELAKIYQLWELVKDREVRDTNIEINYYPNGLLKGFDSYPDLNQFENENRKEMFYLCRFSKEEVRKKPISTPSDLEEYCREL